MSVKENLENLATIHGDRSLRYKRDYDTVGDSLMAMFPDGLSLQTANDFGRFAIFVQVHGKLMRYAQQFEEGGQVDSLDDCAVYSMILRHLDDSNSAGHGNNGPDREPHPAPGKAARDSRVRRNKR